MAYKLGNYDEQVDNQITIEAQFYLIDSAHMSSSVPYPYTMEVNLNNGKRLIHGEGAITFKHNGNDAPIFDINAAFKEDTSGTFVSGWGYFLVEKFFFEQKITSFNLSTRATIKFNVNHTDDSKRVGVSFNAIFFLPPYVLFEKFNDCKFNGSQIESYTYEVVLKIEVSIIYWWTKQKTISNFTFCRKVAFFNFEDQLDCEFSVLIDPNSTYSSIVNKLGLTSPEAINISYFTSSKKIYK